MRKIFGIVFILFLIILLTWTITCMVFDSKFAEVTIDWFAFLAGLFLAIEATYKIIRNPGPVFPDQFLRTIRVIIGTCVFTIHLLQFMRY